MPPSASQRPMCDSSSLKGNSLPTERPRCMTSLACGAAPEPRRGDDSSRSRERGDPPTDVRVAEGITCDFATTGISACSRPFSARASGASGSARCATAPPLSAPPPSDARRLPEEGVPGSRAPHSSQYCAPSRFSVWHLSQLIMSACVLEVCDRQCGLPRPGNASNPSGATRERHTKAPDGYCTAKRESRQQHQRVLLAISY